MLPLVEDFVQRFKLDDFVVVADSGLMNKSNINLLESGGHKCILGARIKSEPKKTRQWILLLEKQDGVFNELQLDGGARLIVGYSDKRAKNNEKGVKCLQKAYKSGNITKENINKRGYNKFLEIFDNVKVAINAQKIAENSKWDVLKGYLTNTSHPSKEIHEQYAGLWVVESAFRVTKGPIEIRSMFHFKTRRIETQVCICFIEYKVYKELERILKMSGSNLSIDKMLNITKTIATIKIKLPTSNNTLTKSMLITPKQKSIERFFDEDFWKIF